MIGRTLSHYRILEKLGAGGMGEVYRAHDEKLGRDVAVKVLPPGLLSHEEARARFRKEALALSRLSHPHIATILDFDTADGIDFLVMELVEGKTLLEAVREGPLSEKDVVRLGSQLARALAVAHEHGVVHRDLKPGNLALTPDGLLKILDFGLARLERLVEPALGEKTASTDTAVGHVVGTPAYMAPEQLRGKGVDVRTDIYGAGACLYELVTGRRPFGNKSGVELSDAVLHEAPASPRSVRGTVSPGLEAVILKALDKDPELRYQTPKELLVDLERLQAAATSGAASQPIAVVVVGRRRRWLWLMAAASGGLLLAAGAWLLRPVPPPRVTNVRPLRLDLGWYSPSGLTSTWATDGVRLYYVAKLQQEYRLFQVPVAGGEPAEIEMPAGFRQGFGIHGFLPRQSALLCLVRPDTIGPGWPVWIVPVPKGSPRRLADLTANTAAISPDGEQIALMQYYERRLVLARADGSGSRVLIQAPSSPGWPSWARDGRIRFAAAAPPGQEGESWIWETTAAGAAPRPLWPGRSGTWTPDGRLFSFERWNESAGRFDAFAVRESPWLPWTQAQPIQLTGGPASFTQVGSRPDGRGLFAFGADRKGELRRFDRRTGRFEPFLGGPSIGYVDPSPDGQWLTWVSYPDEVLWQGRRDGGERTQLTSPPFRAWMPKWSPDGKQIAFVGLAPGEPGRGVWLVPAGGGQLELVARPQNGTGLWDVCWLPDGRSVVFGTRPLNAAPLRKLDLRTRAMSVLPGSEGLTYPKCGSQGQILAVRTTTGVDARLSLVVRWPDHGPWEEVGPVRGNYQTWTRDGRSFCSLSGNRVECYSFAKRRYETLAEIGDMSLLSWVDVPWMSLDVDDSPMVMRDVSTIDLYALDWEAP